MEEVRVRGNLGLGLVAMVSMSIVHRMSAGGANASGTLRCWFVRREGKGMWLRRLDRPRCPARGISTAPRSMQVAGRLVQHAHLTNDASRTSRSHRACMHRLRLCARPSWHHRRAERSTRCLTTNRTASRRDRSSARRWLRHFNRRTRRGGGKTRRRSDRGQHSFAASPTLSRQSVIPSLNASSSCKAYPWACWAIRKNDPIRRLAHNNFNAACRGDPGDEHAKLPPLLHLTRLTIDFECAVLEIPARPAAVSSLPSQRAIDPSDLAARSADQA